MATVALTTNKLLPYPSREATNVAQTLPVEVQENPVVHEDPVRLVLCNLARMQFGEEGIVTYLHSVCTTFTLYLASIITNVSNTGPLYGQAV